MGNNLKKMMAGAFLGASALALSACGNPEAAFEDPHNTPYTGKCTSLKDQQGRDFLKLQDQFGTLVMQGPVTDYAGENNQIHIVNGASERMGGIFRENPLDPTEMYNGNSTLAYNTRNQECIVTLNFGEGPVTHTVSMNGGFQMHPELKEASQYSEVNKILSGRAP